MVEPKVAEGQVVVERTLLEDILESGDRMLDGMTKFVEGVRAIATEPVRDVAPPIVDTPAEPRVWDLTDDALANYDAAQLVALRADHRADNHDAAGCKVCGVLVRRLGSL